MIAHVTDVASPSLALAFRRATAAEWTKFRSVRSSVWTLVIAAFVTVAAGVGFLDSELEGYAGPAGAEAAAAVREGWWFFGLQISLLAIQILGVLVATAEYQSGTIRLTIASVPARLRVLMAKVAAVTAIGLTAGVAQVAAALLAGVAVLNRRSVDVALSEPDVWRGALLATLIVTGAMLFGLAVGMLVRHTAGAIGAVVTVTWVLSAVAHLFPASWATAIAYFPATVMWAAVSPGGAEVTGFVAAAVFFGYVAVLLTAAGFVFVRRDA